MFDKFLKSSNWKFKRSYTEFTDLEKPDIFLMLSCPIQEKISALIKRSSFLDSLRQNFQIFSMKVCFVNP